MRHPFDDMFDLSCTVDVLVGSSTITVRDCLALKPKHVIRLKRVTGADLDLLVNGVTVATGEVVIVNDSTALRIAQIVESQGTGPSR